MTPTEPTERPDENDERIADDDDRADGEQSEPTPDEESDSRQPDPSEPGQDHTA